MNSRTGVRVTVAVLVLVVLLVMGLMIGRQAYIAEEAGPPDLESLNTFIYDKPQPIGAFSLTSEEGEPFTREELRGHWTLAFVGYTYCPDVCPTTLSVLKKVRPLLPDDVVAPQVLFVSADPERDTPSRLKDYLAFFSSAFRGVTGDRETLRALAKDLNAAFSRAPSEAGSEEYTVNHSAHLSLISPQAQGVAMMRPPFKAETIAEAYTRIVKWRQSQL
ncbi:SCO family protein [Marinobacteraceae bacterium S3BR75-40.1]